MNWETPYEIDDVPDEMFTVAPIPVSQWSDQDILLYTDEIKRRFFKRDEYEPQDVAEYVRAILNEFSEEEIIASGRMVLENDIENMNKVRRMFQSMDASDSGKSYIDFRIPNNRKALMTDPGEPLPKDEMDIEEIRVKRRQRSESSVIDRGLWTSTTETYTKNLGRLALSEISSSVGDIRADRSYDHILDLVWELNTQLEYDGHTPELLVVGEYLYNELDNDIQIALDDMFVDVQIDRTGLLNGDVYLVDRDSFGYEVEWKRPTITVSGGASLPVLEITHDINYAVLADNAIAIETVPERMINDDA